jgi:hypothetical protein
MEVLLNKNKHLSFIDTKMYTVLARRNKKVSNARRIRIETRTK